MPVKIMTIFGTRPDAIKMAPVILELQRFPEQIDVVVAVTGQHREMLQQVLETFEITPKYNLDIMKEGQSLTQITTRSLDGLDELIKIERPDMILTQGDTTTTFTASLAAFYNKVTIGHVEAGLRTDNKYDPFPEEINRRLTSVLADLHFAPTQMAIDNLLAEGIPAEKISITGNTVIDTLLTVANRDYVFDDPALNQIVTGNRRMILVTAHRRENWGSPMINIGSAVKKIALENDDIDIIFSLHKNPIVRETITGILSNLKNVYLIEPPDYVPFVHLLKRSYLVLTDSGGVQEEAPSLGIPVLVMRKTTERPEGVIAGTSRLVGTEINTIFDSVTELIHSQNTYNNMAQTINPFGDGSASKKIRGIIFNYFGLEEEQE
ncbi:MAG: non-hydrolyzing UDP-N-acetylglucosamine 2-epimerase [Armatimonadota bacterium]